MSENDERGRAAGQRREDRLAAGKGSAEIAQATKAGREIESTFRVYRKEWTFDSRHDAEEKAREHATQTYGGRLEDDDVRVTNDGSTPPWVVWTRKWNVESEWKNEDLALAHVGDLARMGRTSDTEIVPRNSRREHQLRQHGILKLAR